MLLDSAIPDIDLAAPSSSSSGNGAPAIPPLMGSTSEVMTFRPGVEPMSSFLHQAGFPNRYSHYEPLIRATTIHRSLGQKD